MSLSIDPAVHRTREPPTASTTLIDYSILTQTVTQTSLTNPSGSSTCTTSNPSTSSSGTSNPTSSSSRSLPLGAIIGGLLGATALLLLFIFLLLKNRSSQRGNAKIDPPILTPFVRERLGGLDNEPGSAPAGLTFPPLAQTACRSPQTISPPNPIANHDYDVTSIGRGKFGTRTNCGYLGTLGSSYQKNQRPFQSNFSDNLITNSSSREEITIHKPTCISNPSQIQFQIPLTNSSADSDHAPPAYNSLMPVKGVCVQEGGEMHSQRQLLRAQTVDK